MDKKTVIKIFVNFARNCEDEEKKLDLFDHMLRQAQISSYNQPDEIDSKRRKKRFAFSFFNMALVDWYIGGPEHTESYVRDADVYIDLITSEYDEYSQEISRAGLQIAIEEEKPYLILIEKGMEDDKRVEEIFGEVPHGKVKTFRSGIQIQTIFLRFISEAIKQLT